MRPMDWVKNLLNRHGLEKPDSRPLYQYRITNYEFDSLTDLLKLTSLMGITNINRMLFWDAIFVIYASEWWRRHYIGHWGWGDIFDSIGIDYSELPTGQCSGLMEQDTLMRDN